MSVRTVAAALLTLTALPAAAQAQSYEARGTEPFWSLSIGDKAMRFEAPGRPPVIQPTPRVIHGFAGEIWQSRRINVNTVHKQCSDGMSDSTYSDTVQVTVDGRRYQGCGGAYTAAPAPGSVIEGEWRIVAIGGNPVSPLSHPTINFKDGRVSGNASCNSYGGSFTLERGRLQVGPLISTKMACAERVRNVQESSIFQLLRERLSVSSNRSGKLVLTTSRGATLTLAPAERR